jgi:hypothetical protein
MRGRLDSILRAAEQPFRGERPIASLVRLYVAVNVLALTAALVLTGLSQPAHGAAEAVWTWCRIG